MATMAVGQPAQEPGDALNQRINRLIEQLGDQDYFVRQQAQAELAKLGFEAFDALSAATTHEDLEIAARAKYLLRLIRVQWTMESDPPEVKRCLREYEFLDAESRLARMRSLAGLPGAVGIPALCRLVRFEQSSVLSKHAALQILGYGPPGKPPPQELAEAVRKNLAGCRRPAAKWLQSHLRFGEDPAAALTAWASLVEAEQSLLQHSANQTEPRLVAALLRFQINWLEKLQRRDDALAAIRQLIELEKGDPATLVELIDWLVQQKAWEVINEVAARFAVQFSNNPLLVYALAEAQAAQGDKQRAEETAQRARKLNPGKDESALNVHALMAIHLGQRGLLSWAEWEYRHVIANGEAGHVLTVTAQVLLSEMLHDRGEDLKAGEVLREFDQTVGKDKSGDEVVVISFGMQVVERSLAEIRSRMHCFFACHWQDQGDRVQHRKHLDAALKANPADVDVLIACYRVPDPTPEYRRKILELIKKSAAELRIQIADDPEDSDTCNQFAWLIGNTEGDYDEALKYSKTSVELSPDKGGYFDTLARVYYAKGDYENAVKHQTRAAELDPHSGLIARQLELFRKARDAKKTKPQQ